MRLSCKTIERFMGRLAEGGAAPRTRRRIKEHLASCPDCRRLADAHRAVADALLEAEPVERPGLAARLLEAAGEPAAMKESTAIGCARVSDLAAAFTDGTLDAALARSISRHRAACASCDCLLAAHEALRTVFESMPALAAPAGLTGRIFSLAAAEHIPLPARHRRVDIRRYGAPAVLALGSGLIAAAGLRLLQTAVPDLSASINLAAARLLGFLAVYAPGLVSYLYGITDSTDMVLPLSALTVLGLAGVMWRYYVTPVTASSAGWVMASPPDRYRRHR